jgi:hypothetical protein
MPITPDTKDWTWVLERVCPECAFDVHSFERSQMGAMIRSNARAWTQVLSERDDLGRRPSEDVWSPLEYACHVRDVFALYDERLALMLDQDDPEFPNWDQNATAVSERYVDQDPATVSEQLQQRAHELAASFDRIDGEMWDRRGRRSDGASFTVETFARYLIHDPIHHLHDVGAPLRPA